MDCVLLLFKLKLEPPQVDPDRPCFKPSWGESLRMMSQSTFLQTLVNFNKDIINGETVELIEPYLRMDDYNLENAERVAQSVAGLLSWTVAMAKFYEVNKEVLPLKVPNNIKIKSYLLIKLIKCS